jgi:hypothetical protein
MCCSFEGLRRGKARNTNIPPQTSPKSPQGFVSRRAVEEEAVGACDAQRRAPQRPAVSARGFAAAPTMRAVVRGVCSGVGRRRHSGGADGRCSCALASARLGAAAPEGVESDACGRAGDVLRIASSAGQSVCVRALACMCMCQARGAPRCLRGRITFPLACARAAPRRLRPPASRGLAGPAPSGERASRSCLGQCQCSCVCAHVVHGRACRNARH